MHVPPSWNETSTIAVGNLEVRPQNFLVLFNFASVLYFESNICPPMWLNKYLNTWYSIAILWMIALIASIAGACVNYTMLKLHSWRNIRADKYFLINSKSLQILVSEICKVSWNICPFSVRLFFGVVQISIYQAMQNLQCQMQIPLTTEAKVFTN